MTLSIGQVAAFAQVTVRTVRHYHTIGLMPEPPRDSLDRRLYQPEDALRLVRIRALIDAGFSLPDILEVMDEHEIEEQAFGKVRQRVAQRLDQQLAEITEQQHNLTELVEVHNIGISHRVQEVINQFASIVDDPIVISENRDLWQAVSAQFPAEIVESYAQQELVLLENSEYQHLLQQYAEIWHAPIDDPRLDEVTQGLLKYAEHFLAGVSTAESDFPPVLEFMMDRLPPAVQEIKRRLQEAIYRRQAR